MSVRDLRHVFIAFSGVLLGAGLLMVFSASITARPTEFDQVYLARHVVFLGAAIASGCAAAAMPRGFWKRAAPLLFAVTVLLLAAVLVPGVGHRVNGAQRWFRYGGLSMQPSEFVKLSLPLFVCWWLERARRSPSDSGRGARDRRFRELGVIVPVALVAGLVIAEPDLGTAAFLMGVAAVALFLARWPLTNFVLAAAMAIPAASAVAMLRPYQMERISGYIAAWQDVDAAPYQVRQSLTTLGVGGVRGVGLGRGWQKLSFLPEANTDFVFSVVGEELGLVGTLGLLGLWAGVYLAGVRLFAARDIGSFESAAGVTLLVQLVAQAGMNVAVVTALLPPKGIAHPLISYGGSSLLVSVTALGMIISLSRPPATTTTLIPCVPRPGEETGTQLPQASARDSTGGGATHAPGQGTAAVGV